MHSCALFSFALFTPVMVHFPLSVPLIHFICFLACSFMMMPFSGRTSRDDIPIQVQQYCRNECMVAEAEDSLSVSKEQIIVLTIIAIIMICLMLPRLLYSLLPSSCLSVRVHFTLDFTPKPMKKKQVAKRYEETTSKKIV